MTRRVLSILVAVMLTAGLLAVSPFARAETDLFERTVGFATKTGFRGVFAWEATAAVQAVVHYGTSPDNLDLTVRALPGAPDTAGMAVAEGLQEGATYYFAVEDQLTGERSAVSSFTAENAWTAWDEEAGVYTIDLLVQLTAEELPEDVPGDQALAELAQGMSIVAERIFDATDGYVRVGKVLITDTNLDYAANVPFIWPPNIFVNPPAAGDACPDAHANLSDVLVETAPPADSHTFGGYAISEACTSFYVGRMGWLRIPTFMWEDDLDFGAVSAHEFAHYAFNSPDLYPGSPQGDATGADCRNLTWDGSLLHNTGKYNKASGRWEMTELDRGNDITPCEMGTSENSWDRLVERYDRIPAEAKGIVDHPIDTKARGNPDGGALELIVLDRDPGTSSLSDFTPDDSSPYEKPPCSPAGPQLVDAKGDATGLVVEGSYLPNEPSLDVVTSHVTYDGEARAVTFHIGLDDLTAAPPPGATGRYFRYGFQYGPTVFQVIASHDAVRAPAFRLSAGGASAPLQGAFDPEADEVRFTVPATTFAATDDDGARLFPDAPPLEPGQVITGLSVLSQRYTGVVTPTAESAAGHCDYRVAQDLDPHNRPPVAADDTASTDEDTLVRIDVLANDRDPDGDPLRVTAVSTPAHGTVHVHDGALHYLPAPDFAGRDDLTYTVDDGRFGVATATVTITVEDVADDVQARDDRAATPAGAAVTVDVLANDRDPDGDALSLATVGTPLFGAAEKGEGGTIRYTPPAGFTGRDRVTYTVASADGTRGTARLTVSVLPPECQTNFADGFDAGSAFDRGWEHDRQDGQSFAGAYGPSIDWGETPDPLATSGGTSMFSDDTLVGGKDDRLVSPPLSLLPGAELRFQHRHYFELDHGELGFDGGVLEVSTDGGATWADIGAGRFRQGGYNGTITKTQSPITGRKAWVGTSGPLPYPSPPDGMVPVVVDLSAFAGDTIRLRWRLATDTNAAPPAGGWWVDDVSVGPLPIATCDLRTPPVARDDRATTDEDRSVLVSVLANDEDPDDDALRIVEVTGPGHGTAVREGEAVRYTPAAGFSGTDTFSYTIADDAGGLDSATVTVAVSDVNDPPVAVDDSATTVRNRAVAIDVLANDRDVDGDALRVSRLFFPEEGGRVWVNTRGEVVYEPRPGYVGTDRFRYELSDGRGGTDRGEVTVTVERRRPGR